MEMLIVLAIIGILAAIAVPSSVTRIIRAQIAEAMPIADIAKPPISQTWAALKTMPVNNQVIGLPVPEKIVGNFVTSVEVNNGAIHITFGNKVNALIKGKVLSLRPAVVEDAPVVPVSWICGNASVPDKMVVKGENKTNIPDQYLPLSCMKR